MQSTRITRQPAATRVTQLAPDDDLVVDLLHDTLAGIEPLTIDDLLDIADLALAVEAGRVTVQTAVI